MATPLRLEAPVRVRFDECAADGCVRASALLRYAQDMAWAHSQAAGFDRAWYTDRDLTWLVRCLTLELSGTVGSGATLGVSTEVTGWRRVWARRRSEIVGPDRAPLAAITTDWVLLGPHGPMRVPPIIQAAFPAPLPTFAPGRVPLPATPPDARLATITVRRHELDPLGHANHAVYADWLEDAIADAGGSATLTAVPRTVRLEFLKSATVGAVLTSATWPTTAGG
ncbi:MAG: acyl-[acyl-carrier-protein] thioesterase, partial [Candidatus Limnocylindrales bacterium]